MRAGSSPRERPCGWRRTNRLLQKKTAPRNRLWRRLSSLQACRAGRLKTVPPPAGVSNDLARKLYNLLAAERRIVRIGDFVFHADSIEELKSRVKAKKATNPRMDVAVFKELTGGLSRKYAIPLLEYLDRERITRRVGNEREIL